MNKKTIGYLSGVIFFLVIVVGGSSLYTVNEREQVIITQFGEPKGEPVKSAGLRLKLPFVQKVNRIEKRILEWDGRANEMPTKDKDYIFVDTYGRWQITDPLKFFQRLRDERSALSRLDDILGSETRNTIAKHKLIEVIRTTKDRVPVQPDDILEADRTGTVGVLPPVILGRSVLEKEIFEKSREKLQEFGIELLDVRFKRINYNQSVQKRIDTRMISERQQIAERFRSEGAGEAAKIEGNTQKDLKKIESEAYKKVQTIEGIADAKATEIYASAYNASAETAEFYEFVRTMELYGDILGGKSTVVLSTNSDLFKYLKTVKPETVRKEGAGIDLP